MVATAAAASAATTVAAADNAAVDRLQRGYLRLSTIVNRPLTITIRYGQ